MSIGVNIPMVYSIPPTLTLWKDNCSCFWIGIFGSTTWNWSRLGRDSSIQSSHVWERQKNTESPFFWPRNNSHSNNHNMFHAIVLSNSTFHTQGTRLLAVYSQLLRIVTQEHRQFRVFHLTTTIPSTRSILQTSWMPSMDMCRVWMHPDYGAMFPTMSTHHVTTSMLRTAWCHPILSQPPINTQLTISLTMIPSLLFYH